MRLDVQSDVTQVTRMLNDLAQKNVPIAAARALNKTITNVRTEASRAIRIERALSAKVVKAALNTSKATRYKLTASLTASGRPIPLREYAARETLKGVTVKVSPGARKRIKVNGNAAFLIDKYGGHVFVRTTNERLPIEKRYGPSIPSTFLKGAVVKAFTKVGSDNWPKRFQEELNYELSKK